MYYIINFQWKFTAFYLHVINGNVSLLLQTIKVTSLIMNYGVCLFFLFLLRVLDGIFTCSIDPFFVSKNVCQASISKISVEESST